MWPQTHDSQRQSVTGNPKKEKNIDQRHEHSEINGKRLSHTNCEKKGRSCAHKINSAGQKGLEKVLTCCLQSGRSRNYMKYSSHYELTANIYI